MKKKKKKKISKERRLLGRWVFSLANRLMTEDGLLQSEAFRKAHKARRLLERMGEAIVTFEYEREDHTYGKARGTLRKDLMPPYKKKAKKKKRKSDGFPLTFCYYDVEKKGFRSFRASRNITIIEIPEDEEEL